jgi:hypothetical protein
LALLNADLPAKINESDSVRFASANPSVERIAARSAEATPASANALSNASLVQVFEAILSAVSASLNSNSSSIRCFCTSLIFASRTALWVKLPLAASFFVIKPASTSICSV